MDTKLVKLFAKKMTGLTQEEIYQALSREFEFSKQIFQEIMAQLVTSEDEIIPIKNLITVYLDADSNLC